MRVASTSSRSPSRVPAFAPHRRSTSFSAASWSRFVRIGRTSAAMLHLLHVDLVVVAVRADPLDPQDALNALPPHGTASMPEGDPFRHPIMADVRASP